MSALKAVFAGLAVLAASGCANETLPVGIPPSDFGNASSQNIAAETVNPTAPIDKGPISVNAQRAGLQLDRYVTDMVTPPASIGTGVGIGGGNSGSNGSGGGAGGTGAVAAPAAQ